MMGWMDDLALPLTGMMGGSALGCAIYGTFGAVTGIVVGLVIGILARRSR